MELVIHEREFKVLRSEQIDATTGARLRPPPSTTSFRITAGVADVRWSDFTVPDAATGHKIDAGQTFLYLGNTNKFRLFGGIVHVTYYEALS